MSFSDGYAHWQRVISPDTMKIWNPEWWLIVYAGIAIGILVASGTQIFTWKLENMENMVSEHRPPAFEEIKWPRYPDDLP